MVRYAAPASLLILTACLVAMAALSVGALPLVGSAGPVMSLQEMIHAGFVDPIGKPIAVGALLFVGLWPTMLLFEQARVRRASADGAVAQVATEPEADSKYKFKLKSKKPVGEVLEEEPETNVLSARERLASRRREIMPDAEATAAGEDFVVESPFGDGGDPWGDPDDDDENASRDENSRADPFEELATSDIYEGAQSFADAPTEGETLEDVDHPAGVVPFPSDNSDEDAAEIPDSEPADGKWTDGIDFPSESGGSMLEVEHEHDAGRAQIDEADQMALLGLVEGREPDLPPLPKLPKLPNAADYDPDGSSDLAPTPASSLTSILGPAPFSNTDYDDEEDEEEDDSNRPRPDWLNLVERQAIVLRRMVPPPSEVGLSFYGGKPIVPDAFEWPRKKIEGQKRPLHFLLQVDLSKVPENARAGLLPESGVMYVFLDLQFGTEKGFRVLHYDGPTADWREAQVPDDLSPLYGEEARYSWPWLDSENADETGMPRLLPLWFFDPVVARLPEASPLERDGENGVRWWPTDDVIAEEMERVQGDEVLPDTSEPVDKDGRLLRPYSNYPHDWRAMAITAVQILEELRKPSFTDACRQRQMSEEETRKMRGEWAEQAREVLAWANSRDPFDRVPQEQSDLFWDWFRRLEAVNYLVIGRAARHAIEATLSASPVANEVFGEDALQLIRARHSLAVMTEDGLIVPTPHRMLAPASYVLGALDEVSKDEVLLLEIAADDGLGLLLGDMVYQFTIRSEDLRERRFENAHLTVSSC